MKDREHQIQTACISWFRLQYNDLLIFAIPNGGARTVATGARLKAEGVTAGVPDLFLPLARAGYNGLFIEMKTDEGRLSENQKTAIQRLNAQNYAVKVCRSLDDFVKIINNYIKNNAI